MKSEAEKVAREQPVPAQPADTTSARLEELEWCRQYVKEGTDEFSPSKIIDKRIAELKDMQVTDIPIRRW
jgi:hypothetical protein